MAYTTVTNFSYGALFAYVYRSYKSNTQGGRYRKIGSIVRADFYPHGLDGLSGAEIVLSWHGMPLVTVTNDSLYLHPLEHATKPMLRFVNEVLANVASGHRIESTSYLTMYYEDRAIAHGFKTGWYFNDEGYFYEINGAAKRNYTKEDN